MTKQNGIFRRLVALCLLLGVLLSAAACAKNTPEDTTAPSETTGKVTYTVELLSQGGQPLAGVGIYVYTDETMEELVWFDRTDDTGAISFTDVQMDGCIAVLSGLPQGYQVADSYPLTGLQTCIVLSAVLDKPEDPDNVVYRLGDAMYDFTVTAADGTVYSLAKLLEEKEAVVLNFWYLECQPCRMEFLYLQEAYEQYSDRIEVLAMNPVNTDADAVETFRSENGYTFPMMLCDSGWQDMMRLMAYPTTVVVDRYGTISLIHEGSITQTETFRNIFDYYASEDYTQGVVNSVEDLPEAAPEQGSESAPIDMGVTDRFTVTIPAKGKIHLNIYKVTNQYLYVYSKDAYVEYAGSVYYPDSNGVGVSVTSEYTNEGVPVAIGNSSDQDQTFTVTMTAPGGSYSNPFAMELGTFTVRVYSGNDQGVYFSYIAQEDAVLTTQCVSATAGVDYDLVLYNLTSYEYRNLGDSEGDSVSVNIRKGDRISFVAASLPDDSGAYPSAELTIKAFLGEPVEEEEEKEETLAYAVTVTDEDRAGIPGVQFFLEVEGQTRTLITDENGVAAARLPKGTYTATMRIPEGYKARTTTYPLTEKIPAVAVKLDKIITELCTYTVQVLDEQGKAIAGAQVTVGDTLRQTDSQGKAWFSLNKAAYSVTAGAQGYGAVTADFGDGTELVLTLQKLGDQFQGLDYAVCVADHTGKPVTGAVATFLSQGVTAGVAPVNSEGLATIRLPKGEYTVKLAFEDSRYYCNTKGVLLTAQKPEGALTVAVKQDGTFTETYMGKMYHLLPGATYVTGQADVVNYFMFQPEISGSYRITTDDPLAKLSSWGSNIQFIAEQSDVVDEINNCFTVNVKEQNVEAQMSYFIGITGVNGCVITVERTGDAVLDETDEAWSYNWQTGKTPSQIYDAPAGQLTYLDMTAPAGTYTAVYNEADGYYHLNSKTGPVIFLRLDAEAKYLSFKTMLETSGIRKYFYDSNGTFLKKEDYTGYMAACVSCADPDVGVYPLTGDLAYILQEYGDAAGWYDPQSLSYLFGSTEVDRNAAWMFACCCIE